MKKFARSQDVKIPSIDRVIGRFISWHELEYEIYDDDKVDSFCVYFSGTIQDACNSHLTIKFEDGSIEQVRLERLVHGYIDQDDINRALIANHFAQRRYAELKAREDDTAGYDIYALIDPRNGAIRYIGMSFDADERFKQHLNCEGNNERKNAWIQGLKNRGLLPVLAIVEVVEGRLRTLEREQYWIQFYAEQGADLINLEVAS